jgi:chemotaxis protein CheC
MINLLNDDRKDALTEIMNISYGMATSIISDSIEAHANLHVPRIHIVGIEGLENFVNSKTSKNNDYYVSVQVFINKLDGESIFIIDKDSASKVASMFMSDSNEIVENEEDITSSIHELSNILTSACVGKIAELLDLEVFFHPPALDKQSGAKIAEYKNFENFNKIIVVETVLDFQKEEIDGLLIFLLKESSFDNLLIALDRYIEQYEI